MYKNRSEKRDKYYELVCELYFKEKKSITTISKRFSIPRTTIRRWICNFAEENRIEMGLEKHYKKIDRQSVGEHSDIIPKKDEKALLAEIKRLERELRREKLRADLNEEIINVAEQKFNIHIRKKAGAKR